MRLFITDTFADDYKQLEKKLKSPLKVRNAFYKAIHLLQTGKNLSSAYTVNQLKTQGEGWFDCYIYEDIVMIYKIQGQSVKLTRIGFTKDLFK